MREDRPEPIPPQCETARRAWVTGLYGEDGGGRPAHLDRCEACANLTSGLAPAALGRDDEEPTPWLAPRVWAAVERLPASPPAAVPVPVPFDGVRPTRPSRLSPRPPRWESAAALGVCALALGSLALEVGDSSAVLLELLPPTLPRPVSPASWGVLNLALAGLVGAVGALVSLPILVAGTPRHAGGET